MPTSAMQDASYLTQKKRSVTLYAANKALNTAVASGQSVRREQPDMQLNEIVTYRRQASANTNPNDTCPCSVPVDKKSPANCNNIQ